MEAQFSNKKASGLHQNDNRRQFLLERLLDAVKQCQIRFGGRKEIASDSDSRVICLCAQFEAVLQHGLKRSKGLALTAAAIKQAAGFSSKAETEPVYWYYVKEHLNRHELSRFYSLKNIITDVGRARAWLRCALNEHSLERYMHMLLADRNRLSTFYEDWSFVMDEERASMLPTMAAGLNSILFAINIDNKDLNGQNKPSTTVTDLLKESKQNVTSLLKESTHGVSNLLKEITTVSTMSGLIKPEQECDPLPVVSRSAYSEVKNKKDRKKKKKVTTIISFDDEEEEEEDQNPLDPGKPSISRESSEENSDRASATIDASSLSLPTVSRNCDLDCKEHTSECKNESICFNGHPDIKILDMKSIDDEDADDDSDEDDVYGKTSQCEEIREDRAPLEKNPEETLPSWTPLHVLRDNDSSCILFSVSAVGSYSHSDTTSDNLIYGDDHEGAALAVDLAQKGSQLQFSMDASPPVQAHSFNSLLPSANVAESMTINELRQAIVAMMNRKDELEEQSRSLRNLLDGEMEHSAALRQEIDSLKRKVAEQDEHHTGKVQALARENEVLKVQLKKYVGAVQMLKREGGQPNEILPGHWNSDGELTFPEPKPVVDTEELASSYERKLIEVAEMHGELTEFNERLHRSLIAKEALISQMRQELIDLRGPVPGDLSQTSEEQSLSDFEIVNRALINVWIPSVFLRGKATSAYHVYQVYIRIRDDEWNVYRRYSEFRWLHQKLRSKYPQVDTFNFPPKKAIGNKDAKFVEQRRKELQNYLRNVMNKIIQSLPEFTANPSKETLTRLVPFCVDLLPAGEPVSKSSRSKASSRFSKLSRSNHREPRNIEPQSGDL